MALRRLLLVSVTTVGLLALPGLVSSATADDTGLPVAKAASTKLEPPFDTRIGFLSFDRVRRYGSDTVVVGQILTDHGAGLGSLHGTVSLERRYQGSTNWVELGTADTSDTDHPKFTFRMRTTANAFYRVRFGGDANNRPSSKDAKVSAYRQVTTHVKSRQLLVYGKVAPSYTGKRMVVERKTCASCKYKAVRTIKVKAQSRYQTTLSAPANGRWWWRVTTRADKKFIASPSATIVTRRL